MAPGRLPAACAGALALSIGLGSAACGTQRPTATASALASASGSPASTGAPPPGTTSPPPTGPTSPPLRAPAKSATRVTPVVAPAPARPAIVSRPIPFGARRKAEMTAYARRHYGLSTYRLINPRVVVIHYSETPDFQATYNTFAPDVRDSELHELPGTCAHFVIDGAGVVYQLVPLGIMCRHTVGLNWTAIGIEHVGYSDAQVLGNRRQLDASLRLVGWLRCTYRIAVSNVIGHNESLSSPYHHENVSALRSQTHGDFNHADMQVYRARLRAGATTC